MTRAFFSRVLACGGVVTRRYFYMVERDDDDDIVRIVRYRRNADGACWLYGGYVCAVYPYSVSGCLLAVAD